MAETYWEMWVTVFISSLQIPPEESCSTRFIQRATDKCFLFYILANLTPEARPTFWPERMAG